MEGNESGLDIPEETNISITKKAVRWTLRTTDTEDNQTIHGRYSGQRQKGSLSAGN